MRIIKPLMLMMAGFILLSLVVAGIYRFIAPPVTITMLTDPNGAARSWVSLKGIDRTMVRAAIAAEDAQFCSHDGFDREAIRKAAEYNARGKRIRGGSTISQQTAKNVFLWQGDGWSRYLRKGLEVWFTFVIEKLWGKRRIMEVYLNVAETGIGTYGVEAGAQRYFHHSAYHLTPTEAARIAAVLPSPKKRGAVNPKGFTRRYGNAITRRAGTVRNDKLDACVYPHAS